MQNQNKQENLIDLENHHWKQPLSHHFSFIVYVLYKHNESVNRAETIRQLTGREYDYFNDLINCLNHFIK